LGIPITVIGAGAIGSFTALALAKMGFSEIVVHDFDRIEEENMNCQFYRHTDVGRPKVEALRDLIESFTEVKIGVRGKYDGGAIPGIVIAAVDSMTVRKLIWDNHRGKAAATIAIVDPRMGAEEALLYCMNPMDPNDQASYEKTLYTDDAAVQERCTAKSTVYTACLLSGLVAKTVKDLATGFAKYPRISHWSIKNNHLVTWSKPGIVSAEVKSETTETPPAPIEATA
jgi:molybdopterin/thiamine biosynthesis adenylyltransferase